MQKRTKLASAIAVIGLTLACQSATAFASETVLTVDTSLRIEEPAPPSEPEAPKLRPVYPIDINYAPFNGWEAVRRTYALDPDEDPQAIPLEAFEMFGQFYRFAEIVKKDVSEDMTMHMSKEVAIETTTDNMNEIMPLLEQEIEYDQDGYAGTLKLNVQSLRVEEAGRRATSFTSTKTRTYPNLSSSDLSLIPKTITDGGREYSLADVSWSNASIEAVGGMPVAHTFTANATYSRTGAGSTVTGYVVTAEYTGAVHKTVFGKTLYTVVFLSQPVVLELPDPIEPEPETEAPAVPVRQPGNGSNVWPVILAILGSIVGVGAIGFGAFYVGKQAASKNVTVCVLTEGPDGRPQFREAGKLKIDLKSDNPEIDLTAYEGQGKADRYAVIVAQRAVDKLVGKTITIRMGGQKRCQPVTPAAAGSSMQIDLNFSSDYIDESAALRGAASEGYEMAAEPE